MTYILFLKKFLFVLVFLAGLQFSAGFVPQKVLLSVYYESRCPDSRSFILRQLTPSMKLLSEYIILRLVPFGKAKRIDQRYGAFECQHGPSECLGNVVQSCVLELMQGSSDMQRFQYVACEMSTYAATNGDLSCAQRMAVAPDLVKECIISGKGADLQLEAEFLTDLIQPKFVPTITIDGVFNQQTQDQALFDLVGTLCSILKETKECAQYYNRLALKYVLLQ